MIAKDLSTASDLWRKNFWAGHGSDALEGISYLEQGEVQAVCKQSFAFRCPIFLPFTVYKQTRQQCEKRCSPKLKTDLYCRMSDGLSFYFAVLCSDMSGLSVKLISHKNSSAASRMSLKWIVTVPPECSLSPPPLYTDWLTEQHQIWLTFLPPHL